MRCIGTQSRARARNRKRPAHGDIIAISATQTRSARKRSVPGSFSTRLTDRYTLLVGRLFCRMINSYIMCDKIEKFERLYTFMHRSCKHVRKCCESGQRHDRTARESVYVYIAVHRHPEGRISQFCESAERSARRRPSRTFSRFRRRKRKRRARVYAAGARKRVLHRVRAWCK